jgi:conjugative relaxase-like TrwC/TraI family protein
MAWMRMMGAESVAYHRATILERGDDYPGQALAYYASRGETPLVWGGSGAERLGLAGAVSGDAYEAVYGPGGAKHPATGERLVTARRPGMELVISSHKSVAELGVIGRAEDMHAIMDAERDATLAYLDGVTKTVGGRRGRASLTTPTGGLVYAHTRHATSRAGDPCPHDHVLLANVVEMLDERGGWKAANTSLWREHLHAATMTGRMAAARRVVELGYGIDADPGPSGRLGHWRIAGIPDDILALHSKRAAEITAAVEARGEDTYQARGVAARTTRSAKHHHAEGELVARWQAELAATGWPSDRVLASVEAASGHRIAGPQSLEEARRVLTKVLDDGELASRKVFSRRHLIVQLAPHLYGWEPRILPVLADRLVADPAVIPLVGTTNPLEPVYALASVLAREGAIAEGLARQLDRTDVPTCEPPVVAVAVRKVEAEIGGQLSVEQRQAVESICTSGRGAELVVGVAGAGKTTMLAAVAAAMEAAGCEVIGTATSGQAARTLGSGANLGESRTLASLSWRLEHHQVRLGERSVVILDEAGMTDDTDLLRLLAHVETAGAKLIMVGDHRQLGAVGPGGALGALVARHPDAVHTLAENRRQNDPGEREILAELRDGHAARAVDWYAERGRIRAVPDRQEALQATVDAWAADVAAGKDVGLYAWRRANVAELNTAARAWMDQSGRLTGPEIICPGGAAYRAGDQVMALAPDHDNGLVTSQRGVVETVDPAGAAVVVRVDDGRLVRLSGEQTGADRLGYSYATTVHRAQGSTMDAAHLFADGGGRELAYVAMSRARTSTTAWAVADDVAEAVEDLTRDWSTSRTPTWALDAGLPDPNHLDPHALAGLGQEERIRLVAVAHAQTRLTLQATAGIGTSARPVELDAAVAALRQAKADRDDVDSGQGSYRDTPVGHAVTGLARARDERRQVEWLTQHGERGWYRRQASRQLPACVQREADARHRWETHVAPEAARLDVVIGQLETAVADLTRCHEAGQARLAKLAERQSQQQSSATKLAAPLAARRRQLDGDSRRPAPPSQDRHHLAAALVSAVYEPAQRPNASLEL